VTSQFAQHVRAVLGWPLGATEYRCPTVTANVLGAPDETERRAELDGVERVLEAPGAALHWYGKRRVRPLRKMGHLTLVPADGQGRRDAEAGASGGDGADGFDVDGADDVDSADDVDGTDDIGIDGLLERVRDLRDGVSFA